MYTNLIANLRDVPSNPDDGLCALCLVHLEHADELGVALGHVEASSVAEEFRRRLGTMLRDQDQLVPLTEHRHAFILGGLIHRHHVALALAKLERLFDAPVSAAGRPVKLTASVGVAIARSRQAAGREADQLLRNAQRALIASSERGGPVIADDLPCTSGAMDWSDLGRLAAGLEQGEFVPFFQPIVSARTEAMVGAELLLRWSSPDLGLIMPGRFIPLVEQADLIRPLTWYALKAGIAQATQWPGALTVSVNAAAASIVDDELVRVIGDGLAVYGLDANRLIVEVTESGMMNTNATDVLRSIRELGVKVAIDDFGTGYSSFAHFRDVPADELKIDRSFIANLRNTVDERLIRSIVELAHNLGLTVVAEGVEDRETADRLRELGCDLLQGFLFGRPATASQLLQGRVAEII
jgi:EAL domain-containing protein (putative c-di-GMP-specific phosphodiesterase class I)/GGDEF domain-containing protein